MVANACMNWQFTSDLEVVATSPRLENFLKLVSKLLPPLVRRRWGTPKLSTYWHFTAWSSHGSQLFAATSFQVKTTFLCCGGQILSFDWFDLISSAGLKKVKIFEALIAKALISHMKQHVFFFCVQQNVTRSTVLVPQITVCYCNPYSHNHHWQKLPHHTRWFLQNL